VIYFMLLFGLSMLSRRLELKDPHIAAEMRENIFFNRPQLAMVPAASPPAQ
jgi:hypothetical protein